MLLRLLLAAMMLLPLSALAGTDTTRDALERLEEVLELRIEDGRLDPEQVLPAILVSTDPRYEASVDWFSVRSVEVLEGAFGTGTLRLCEACMAPRAFVENGYLAYQTGPVALDEVVRLDEQSRGKSRPARSGIWINETQGGVAVRIVDLSNGRILFAQNIDPYLVENDNTQRMYSLSEELERRARGDSLTQAFADFVVYPGQHISFDWTDQWGPANGQMSGFSISLFDPVVGLGAVHYSVIEFFNIQVGAKLLMSLPTALVRAVSEADFELIDPIMTGVGIVRVPFGRSNYGAVVSISSNGQAGIGLSLMNISLLPVIL